MARVVGSQLPMWETWIEFWTPGSGLAQTLAILGFGESEPADGRSLKSIRKRKTSRRVCCRARRQFWTVHFGPLLSLLFPTPPPLEGLIALPPSSFSSCHLPSPAAPSLHGAHQKTPTLVEPTSQRKGGHGKGDHGARLIPPQLQVQAIQPLRAQCCRRPLDTPGPGPTSPPTGVSPAVPALNWVPNQSSKQALGDANHSFPASRSW